MARTPKDILMDPYVYAKDLAILLHISYSQARKTWQMMSKADDEELGAYRVCPNKIRLQPALKRLGISYKTLCEQNGLKDQ